MKTCIISPLSLYNDFDNINSLNYQEELGIFIKNLSNCNNIFTYQFKNIIGITFNNKKAIIHSKIYTSSFYAAEEYKLYDNDNLKITLPGIETMIFLLENNFYNNDEDLYKDLEITLKNQIYLCIKSGCKYIQIDEPILVLDKLEKVLERYNKLLAFINNEFKILHIPSYLIRKENIELLNKSIFNIISIVDVKDYEIASNLTKTVVIYLPTLSGNWEDDCKKINERLLLGQKYFNNFIIAMDLNILDLKNKYNNYQSKEIINLIHNFQIK